SYDEAMASPESHRWKSAMDKEMLSLSYNDTYVLKPCPKGHSVI
ncbi:hypothetical protein FHG87_022914, partial [Trinorchestia longiramus]